MSNQICFTKLLKWTSHTEILFTMFHFENQLYSVFCHYIWLRASWSCLCVIEAHAKIALAHVFSRAEWVVACRTLLNRAMALLVGPVSLTINKNASDLQTAALEGPKGYSSLSVLINNIKWNFETNNSPKLLSYCRPVSDIVPFFCFLTLQSTFQPKSPGPVMPTVFPKWWNFFTLSWRA